MKSYKLLVFIVLSLFIIESCKRRENYSKQHFGKDSLEKVNKAFFSALKHIERGENLSYCTAYVVIPDASCANCISEAKMLLKTNVNDDKNVKFILTKINGVKQTEIAKQMNVANNHNVFLDKENLFDKGILFSIYPRVYLLDEGRIIKEVEVSPFEDGLGALKAHLGID